VINYTASLISSEIASHNAFVYLIFVRDIKILYIGQTFSRCGALGRLAQHLSDTSSNTLKQRACSILQYEEIELKDIQFNAACLSQNRSFVQESSDYREAVEALVNNRIINFVAKYKIGVVVSRIRANRYSELKFIKDEANLVATTFESWLLNSLC
jgi:predicted GIY-YIG superfamily endonuclease